MPSCIIQYNPACWSAKESRRFSGKQGTIIGYSQNKLGVGVRFPIEGYESCPDMHNTIWFDTSCIKPSINSAA